MTPTIGLFFMELGVYSFGEQFRFNCIMWFFLSFVMVLLQSEVLSEKWDYNGEDFTLEQAVKEHKKALETAQLQES